MGKRWRHLELKNDDFLLSDRSWQCPFMYSDAKPISFFEELALFARRDVLQFPDIVIIAHQLVDVLAIADSMELY